MFYFFATILDWFFVNDFVVSIFHSCAIIYIMVGLWNISSIKLNSAQSLRLLNKKGSIIGISTLVSKLQMRTHSQNVIFELGLMRNVFTGYKYVIKLLIDRFRLKSVFLLANMGSKHYHIYWIKHIKITSSQFPGSFINSNILCLDQSALKSLKLLRNWKDSCVFILPKIKFSHMYYECSSPSLEYWLSYVVLEIKNKCQAGHIHGRNYAYPVFHRSAKRIWVNWNKIIPECPLLYR